MDREEFLNALSTTNGVINVEFMDEVIKDSLVPSKEHFAGFMNLIIVNEEFSEIQKEVSKYMRGRIDRVGLLEELADACLSIRYIQHICGISDNELSKAVNVKIKRQDARNKSAMAANVITKT